MKNFLMAALTAAGFAVVAPARAGDQLPDYRAQVSAETQFPDIRRATRPQGVFIPARHIAMVAPGLKKSEVYTLLDVPHFSEGLFGVRRWDYIVNFYTGQGLAFRQCQYQIRYDRHYRVEATYWRDAECAQLFEAALAEPKTIERVVTNVVAPPVAAAERVVKTYSFNFDFNRAEINQDGHTVIDQAVAEARAGHYRKIVVTGLTDTVGSVGYNDSLAARRASATVTELVRKLQSSGSALADETYSRGGRELAVQTGTGIREIRNRRVVIEFY